jgi:hypothetical protein
MTIVDDHAAVGNELRRIQAERWPQQTAIVVPRGVLRVPLITRKIDRAPLDPPADSAATHILGTAAMRTYRAYLLDADNHILNGRYLEASDDEAAIRQAEQLCDQDPTCSAVEIWERDRRLHWHD